MELVLVLPFFALMLLTVAQVGLLVHSRVLVTHAAREAVREAAIGGSNSEIRAAAVAATNLDPHRLSVEVLRSGGRVTVEVTYIDTTDVPVVGPLVGDALFTANATMRLE